MDITKAFTAVNRAELRAWFAQHGSAEPEIWLVFHRKQTGIPTITIDEAQEEALCFGWVDGIMKKLDDQRYALRFTPRKNRENWSEVNIRRVRRLHKQGQMTERGLAVINFPLEGPDEPPDPRTVPDLPADLLARLQSNPAVWENWQNLPPSQKKLYQGWITSAKREETRLKRTSLALEMLEYNLRLGLESPETILARARASRRNDENR